MCAVRDHSLMNAKSADAASVVLSSGADITRVKARRSSGEGHLPYISAGSNLPEMQAMRAVSYLRYRPLPLARRPGMVVSRISSSSARAPTSMRAVGIPSFGSRNIVEQRKRRRLGSRLVK